MYKWNVENLNWEILEHVFVLKIKKKYCVVYALSLVFKVWYQQLITQ